MITKFEQFNEYTSYRGPGAAIGFKTGNPDRAYFLSVDLKTNPKNEENVKMILSFYNVPVVNFEIKKKNRSYETLSIRFLSYNENEAESIINEIFDIFNNAGVKYDAKSVIIFPRIKKPNIPVPVVKHKHIISFFRDKEDSPKENTRNLIGFNR